MCTLSESSAFAGNLCCVSLKEDVTLKTPGNDHEKFPIFQIKAKMCF